MKCRKCGANDWYTRGKYRRCRPCHNKVKARSVLNQKLGVESKSKSKYKSRPLSEQLRALPSGVMLQKKKMTACSRGHDFTEENTRLEADSKGRIHRRCLRCEYLQGRKRYGIDSPGQLHKLLGEKDNPWDRI